jgi:uncharacterized protein (DUF1810 family)
VPSCADPDDLVLEAVLDDTVLRADLDDPAFGAVLDCYFDGVPDEATDRLLAKAT